MIFCLTTAPSEQITIIFFVPFQKIALNPTRMDLHFVNVDAQRWQW